MTYGAFTYNKLQLGGESSSGTAVAADFIWRGPFGDVQDGRTRNISAEQVGLLVPAERSYDSRLTAMLTMPETELTYEQFPHILEAALGTVTPSGSGPYVYAYSFPTGTTPNTLKTYTIEAGNAVVTGDVREVPYCFVESFTISGTTGEAWKMSANWRGQRVVSSSFTSALSLAAVEEAIFSNTSVYIDASGGTIGNTQVAGVLVAASFDVTTGVIPVFTGDGVLYYTAHKFTRPTVNFTLTLELHSGGNVRAERTQYENNAVRLIRLGCPGTSDRDMQIDFVAKYDEVGGYENTEEDTTVQLQGHVVYSPTDDLFFEPTITNNLSALP